jgi:hypothetical protein
MVHSFIEYSRNSVIIIFIKLPDGTTECNVYILDEDLIKQLLYAEKSKATGTASE